jgi:hypothetical protein
MVKKKQLDAATVAEMKRLAMVKHRKGTPYRDALDLIARERGFAGWREVAVLLEAQG